MKHFKYLLVLSFFCHISVAQAQTQLNPGDLGFVQVNYTHMSFDFVLLKSITAGTQIKFTDKSYVSNRGLVNQFLTPTDKASSVRHDYEIVATYTAPENVEAGTIIQSKDNANFDRSSFDYFCHLYDNQYYGETLIAFQVSGNDTTYLSALGWMSANNFKKSLSPGTSEIPPGLSFENNTVVQLDSISSLVQHTLQRDYKYYTGYGTKGSAYYLRSLIAASSHFQTWQSSNTVVSGPFTVLPDDTEPPVLNTAVPANNASNVSVNTDAIFTFNEVINVKKGLTLVNSATTNTVATFTISDISILDDKIVWLNLEGLLESNTAYYIEFPENFLVDNDGNYWPSVSTKIDFTTGAAKNNLLLSFNNEDVEDLTWHKQSDEISGGQHAEVGFFTFSEKGIPCRSYTTFYYYDGDSYLEEYQLNGAIDMMGGRSESTIDLRQISSQITYLKARVMSNTIPLKFNVYSNGKVIQSQTVETTMNSSFREGEYGDPYVNMIFSIDPSAGVDSVQILTLEGALFQLIVEFSDLSAPVVNLGENQMLCEGDSVQLGTTKRIGETILWSTGATSDSIWVKTTGTYSITKTNTMGSVSSSVQVEVLPKIVPPFNGKYESICMGTSIELNAGIEEYTYQWVDTTVTSNLITVSQNKWYTVIITNPACGEVLRDSVYIELMGGSIMAMPNQGGMWNSGDLEGQLYKENSDGFYELYQKDNMSFYFMFVNLPEGNYIFKAHFLDFTFGGENPFMDTYHDGGIVWENVTPIYIDCTTNEMINFSMHDAPSFVFNGSGEIRGTVNTHVVLKSIQASAIACDLKVNLYKDKALIATTCADANGDYSFTNLPEGNYEITVEQMGYDTTTPYQVTVADGQVYSNLDFIVLPEVHAISRNFATQLNRLSQNEVLVYPNPATTQIQVANLEGEVEATLFDCTGKAMASFKLNTVNKSISVAEYKSGVYVLQLRSENQSQNLRFVIAR